MLSLCLQSCYAILGELAGFNAKTVKEKKVEMPGKDVKYVGMMHLAKKEFYNNVAENVNKYQDQGYIMYLEGTPDTINGVKVHFDTTAIKKLRKILGNDLSRSYSEHQNSEVQKIIKKFELVGQPKYKDLAVRSYTYADIPYFEMVEQFEKRHGEVVLDSCDLVTPLGARYKCSVSTGLRQKFSKEIMQDLRNQKLAEKIINSTDKKILIIFGKAHFKPLRKEIKKQLAAAKK